MWLLIKTRFRRSTALLAVANLVLMGALAETLLHGSKARLILAIAPDATTSKKVALDVPGRSIDFLAVQSAAAFYETRQFYVPPIVESKPPRPDFRLVGTMALPQKPMVAMLVHNQTGIQSKVRKGEQLEGWTVISVEPKRVLLQLGDDQLEVNTKSGGSLSGSPTNAVQASASVGEMSSGNVPSGGVRVLGSPAPAQGNSMQGSSGMMLRAPSSESRLYRPPPR